MFIVFQFLLHLVYGDVSPFLYSYHFTPILIIFVVLNLPGVYGTIWALMMAVLLQRTNDYHVFCRFLVCREYHGLQYSSLDDRKQKSPVVRGFPPSRHCYRVTPNVIRNVMLGKLGGTEQT